VDDGGCAPFDEPAGVMRRHGPGGSGPGQLRLARREQRAAEALPLTLKEAV